MAPASGNSFKDGAFFIIFTILALTACQSDDDKAEDNPDSNEALAAIADAKLREVQEKINDLPASATLGNFFKALGVLKTNSSKLNTAVITSRIGAVPELIKAPSNDQM